MTSGSSICFTAIENYRLPEVAAMRYQERDEGGEKKKGGEHMPKD